MTRREREILKASVSWTDKVLTVNEEKAFQAGAKWADEHPKSEMLKRNSMTRNEEIQKLIDEEMRDAFKENFDKDIEFCKELL